MPYVEGEIKEVFHKLVNSIQRTLNTQEATANGCAIHAKLLKDKSFFDFELEGSTPINASKGNMQDQEINYFIKKEDEMK